MVDPLSGPVLVALCDHCVEQRRAAGDGPELAPLVVAVLSGCCHDCGGGFCLCGDRLPCELCPRRNAPLVLGRLVCYQVVVSPPPSTVPAPLGG